MTSCATRALIFAAKRTPICGFGGALSSITAPNLGAVAIKAALAASKCPTTAVEEVIMGNVLSAGVGQAPARQASVYAEIDYSAEATTVNKVCSSGLKAVALGAMMIEHGCRSVVVAGGMESMSLSPYFMPRTVSPRLGTRTLDGHPRALDGMLHDGLWDPYNGIHMGECAERCAAAHKIPRSAMDEYSLRSYKKLREAWSSGRFPGDEVVEMEDTVRASGKSTVNKFSKYLRDSECHERDGSTLATARAAFVKNGAITAGNASKISDGAAALILATAECGKSSGFVKPLAEIVAYGEAAVAPVDFPLAPEHAIQRALKLATLAVSDISRWEINEAFAAVVLVIQHKLGIEESKINVDGGAVAMGHPIGASGARILATLVHGLKPGEYGCAAICNGGGGASAMILKRH